MSSPKTTKSPKCEKKYKKENYYYTYLGPELFVVRTVENIERKNPADKMLKSILKFNDDKMQFHASITCLSLGDKKVLQLKTAIITEKGLENYKASGRLLTWSQLVSNFNGGSKKKKATKTKLLL